MHRITYVVEYDDTVVPTIYPRIEMAGGILVSCQFNDALQELEIYESALQDIDDPKADLALKEGQQLFEDLNVKNIKF